MGATAIKSAVIIQQLEKDLTAARAGNRKSSRQQVEK